MKVAVRNGRFCEPGPGATVLDFGDAFVLPGLIDAHIHLTGVGLDLQCASLIGATSIEEIVARMKAFAATAPDEWLLGNGWDQNLMPDKRWPTHHLLSQAFPNRPVALRRIDCHALLVNETALAIAGIDPDGHMGILIDNDMKAMHHAMPRPTHDQLVRAIKAAVKECNRYGVTAVAEAGVNADFLAAQEAVMDEGAFSLRNYAMLMDDDDLLEQWFERGPLHGGHDGRLWVRAVKMFADGALGSRGAALFEPYCDDRTTSGAFTISQKHIAQIAYASLARGFQPCTHAIGDRANRTVLDAYGLVLLDLPPGDYRPRIEHAQLLAPEDIPKFQQLGVIPSMQSGHHLSEKGWSQDRLGEGRMNRAYAFRELLNTGAIIANGTDAPVEPVSTLRTFYSAITAHGREMTRQEALASMTRWAAYACFLEEEIGAIDAGKRADFVVMDRDWMTCEPEAILETKILATYVGGERVYSA